VVGINEKPTIVHFVNSGIYMLDPRAFEYLGDNGRMDMTDLIVRLMDEGQTVASFPVTEYWLDIGHHDDYMRAQVDIQQGRV
jgi:NDP-sugar pyrophosphorylase family protein